MSTGASSIQPGNETGSSSSLVEYNRFIDKQLWRTRAQVRLVDLASGLLILATGSLAYFFMLALVDHWAVSGGLPGWARLLSFGIYLLVTGWYLVAKVLPLLFWRINPLYAAETIERTQPSLKNSLLNFLMFRAEPRSLSRNVYQAIEEQAATNLARVPIDNVVDRSKLIRIGYVLAGVLALCALYKVLSPKDPIASFGRMVMPWADILPPTRTSIENIEPGNSKAFRGQQVKISAEVRGIERDGEVTLFYTTADGQTVDRPIRMHLPQDGYRHTCTLPPDDDGIQQTVQYRIVAGDARTRDYTLQVVAAPTIVVDSVEYVYPDYTGLSAQTVAHAGDVKAIEGTRVNVHAVANQSIRDGGIDFECDGREELPLAIDGTGDLARGGTVSWVLSLADDRVTPTYTSYQLHFRNADGDQNLRPIRHTIETIPDIAPEIEFLAPKAAEVRVREGDVLPIELTASDPDFALQRVRLLAETDGRKLLDKSPLKNPHRGQFNHKHRLSTKDLGLKAGDVVEYWAVAEDVKSPEPNITTTAKRKFQIVPRDATGEQQDPQDGQQNQPPMAGEPEQPPKDQGDQGEQGEQGDSQDGGEQSKESKSQPQDQGQEGGSDQGDKSQQDDSQSSDGSEDGSSEQQQSGKQSSESNQDKSQEGGDSQGGGDEQSDDQKSGEQTSGEQKSGQQGSEKNDSQQPVANDGTQDGDALEKILNHQQEQQQQDQKQDGQQQPPEQNQSGQDQTGSQKSPQENKQTGGNKGGQEKPNDKQTNPENTQDDSGESSGNERKGEEQPSQTPNAGAQKKEGESGGQKGAEQKGNPQDDAKAGDNSQPGEATDRVSENAKEEWGEPGSKGKQQKASEQDKQEAKEHEQQQQEPGENGKSGSNSGNRRDQQPGAKSNQTGSGEHSKGDDQSGQKPNPGKKPDQSKGGSDEQEKGDSGAGRSGGDEQGSPESQGDGRQRNKQKKSAGQQDDESKQEAQSPSNSNRESDSNDGESEGDRSGAGKQGGGQKANQPGAGGAGKNTAADEGAGQSDEQGEGLESGKAGSQKEAEGQTGQSGDKRGNGSQSRSGDGQSEGEQGKQAGDRPPSEGTPSDQKNNSQGGPGDGSTRGAPQGGGSKGAPAGTPEQQTGREPGGDAANLEYARKATDLALEHLRDQLEKGEPDQDLLDELGWTRDDLQKFLQRWQQMKAAAKENAPRAEQHQRELDDTLRSLGLRPRGTTLGGNRAAEDTQRNLKESHRSSPPAEYAEQYKAYRQGTSRGNK